MVKIGRNDPCSCGSGKKFKKCCYGAAGQGQSAKTTPGQLSLTGEVQKIQQAAVAGKSEVRTIGVFVLFSSDAGDAWLLELTEMDALLVARGGKAIDVEIVESPETLEINWSHRFAVKEKQLHVTAYADKKEEVLVGCPSHSIRAAIKKIRKKFPQELLDSIHLDAPSAAASASGSAE
ncbi:MAG: SEC-C metal-binding domain-containing protein [Desulfobulbaceae bacterium]|nr:SEC-C metal-binding domain-containing protein [Desulfobulbaceae bacterium]